MRTSKWLLIVALALPISTFAIAPKDDIITDVGTVVSISGHVSTDPDFTNTMIVTTKGRYVVKGAAPILNAESISIGEKMTKRGYLLCGEGHTASSLEPICYEVMIGITYRE